jgi:glycosyltransferase involved in cell wall biosynthesis
MSKQEVKISAVIITHNEEKNIERCIRSLLSVADEVIVWDANSADKTKELSERLGAVVYQHEWEGYSKSKNRANAKATGDYILSIDADEELSPELQQNILLRKQTLDAEAYAISRLTNYCGHWIRHSGWYPEYKVRLFKRESAQWLGEIHEQLEFAHEVVPKHIDGDLLHYSILNIEHHLQKITLYSSLAAEKDFHRGVKPSLVYHGVLKPAFHFFKNFFLQLGFLGGYIGFVIAKMAAFERFHRYVKLKEFGRIHSIKSSVIRVLHLSSEKYWRGGEQQIAYLIDELNKFGVESYVCARRGSSFEKYCHRNNIPVRSFGFYNSIDLATTKGIRKCVRDWSIDLVHVHSAKSHRLAVMAASAGSRAPMVLSRRVNFPLHQNFSTYWKYNHSSIKKILCVSRAIEMNMRNFVHEPEKCVTVYSGVDMHRFDGVIANDLRMEYSMPNDAIIIGTTIALDTSKDPVTFVKTIKELIRKNVPAYGVIVGDGPLREQLRELIAKEKLEKNIVLTGFRADVKAMMAGFDYFMLTSIEEGLGTSILDAFLAQKPVVATNVGGIPEMVIHETTGMLAPARDYIALADCLLSLYSNPKLREVIIHNASMTVRNFAKEQMGQKTLEIYKHILTV